MQDSIIRLPSSLHELLYKINRVAQDLGHTLGREPSMYEVANAIEMEPEELSMTLKRAYRVTSLDQKVHDTETGSICDTIADPSCLEDDVNKNQEIAVMMDYFGKYLDSTTQEILKARTLAVPMSWSALEQQMGISKTRLQNLERRGLDRLRMLMSNPLDDTPLGHVTTNNYQTNYFRRLPLSSVPKWYV